MMASRCTWFVSAGLVILAAGCSGQGGGPAAPKTVPAKGKVTYKNLPVAGATVSFVGDGKIPAAIATTEADGTFILTTSQSGDGAVPGTHRVIVSKIVAPPSSAKPKGGSMSMEDAAKTANEPAAAKPLSLLPEKYASADSSRLSFTVKQGDPNDFKIELSD